MISPHEIARIRRAYTGYRTDRLGQTKWSLHNPGNQQIVAERNRALTTLVRSQRPAGLAESRFLELGCGGGSLFPLWLDWGLPPAQLTGIDLLLDRLQDAAEQFPAVAVQQMNGAQLGFRDGSCDIVAISTVFTSILDDQLAQAVADEVDRVLSAQGFIIWYDFRYNNPANSQVRRMDLRRIHQFFPAYQPVLRTVTVLPPLVRRLGRSVRWLYPALRRIPGLKTHYAGVLVRRSLQSFSADQ